MKRIVPLFIIIFIILSITIPVFAIEPLWNNQPSNLYQYNVIYKDKYYPYNYIWISTDKELFWHDESNGQYYCGLKAGTHYNCYKYQNGNWIKTNLYDNYTSVDSYNWLSFPIFEDNDFYHIDYELKDYNGLNVKVSPDNSRYDKDGLPYVPDLLDGQIFGPLGAVGYEYRMVFRRPHADGYMFLASTAPCYVYMDYSDRIAIGLHGTQSYKLFEQVEGKKAWNEVEADALVNDVDDLETVYKPLASYIKYINYNLMSKDGSKCFYNADESTYGEDGFPSDENTQVLIPTPQDQTLKYEIAFYEKTDGKIYMITSDTKLYVDDKISNLDLMGRFNTEYKILFKNYGAWGLKEHDKILVETDKKLGSIVDTTMIIYINYDLYNKDGSKRYFSATDSPYDNDGTENNDQGSEPLTLTDMLWKIFGFLDPTGSDFFLLRAFIPSGDPIQENMQGFMLLVANKFGADSWVDLLATIQNISPSSITFQKTASFYGAGTLNVNFVNLSFFNQYKDQIYSFIRGILALMLIIFNINQIYKLLNRGGTIADGAITMAGKGANRERGTKE